MVVLLPGVGTSYDVATQGMLAGSLGYPGDHMTTGSLNETRTNPFRTANQSIVMSQVPPTPELVMDTIKPDSKYLS